MTTRCSRFESRRAVNGDTVMVVCIGRQTIHVATELKDGKVSYQGHSYPILTTITDNTDFCEYNYPCHDAAVDNFIYSNRKIRSSIFDNDYPYNTKTYGDYNDDNM